MSADQATPRKPRRRRFQFSLRSLLLMVSLAAVCCSGLFSGYGWLAGLTGFVIVMAATVVLVITLWYGHGNLRTFSLAALCPFGLGFAFLTSVAGPYLIVLAILIDDGDLNWGITILGGLSAYFAALITLGLFGIWVRRVIEPITSKAEAQPEESAPDDPLGPFE